MRSLLKRFRAFVSKQDDARSKTGLRVGTDPCDDTPLQYVYLNSNETNSVELELLPPGQTIRIIGVDVSTCCLDFAVKVSLLLGLIPGSHVLMVPNLNFAEHDSTAATAQQLTSPVWQRAPSSSKLSDWLRPVSGMNGDVDAGSGEPGVVFGTLRLVHKSCLKNSLKSGILITHIQNSFKFQMHSAHVKAPKSGRELLDELGTRVLVHLPANRKVVIRAQLNRPIFEAVAEVCSLRNLTPCHYRLQDPLTGTELDPLLSFTSQQTTEFELRECDPALSNLTCLVNVTDSVHWRFSDHECGLYLVVKPRVSRVGTSLASTSRYHTSSATESGFYPRTVRPRSDQLSWSTSSASCLLKLPKSCDTYSCMQRRAQPLRAINPKYHRKRPAPAPPNSIGLPLTATDRGLMSVSLHDLRSDERPELPLRPSSSSSHLNHSEIHDTGSNSGTVGSVRDKSPCSEETLTDVHRTDLLAGAPKMARSKSPSTGPQTSAFAARVSTLPPRTTSTVDRSDMSNLLHLKSASFTTVRPTTPDTLEVIFTPPKEFIGERRTPDPCPIVALDHACNESGQLTRAPSAPVAVGQPSENRLSYALKLDAAGDGKSQRESLTVGSGSTNQRKSAPEVAPRPPKVSLAESCSNSPSTVRPMSTLEPDAAHRLPRSRSFLRELTEAVTKMHSTEM